MVHQKLCAHTLLAAAFMDTETSFNPLNAKLNPICHLLALLGAHHILHISRIRVNYSFLFIYYPIYSFVSIYLFTRVGTLIVATIYLQLIQNRYMFRSFTVL